MLRTNRKSAAAVYLAASVLSLTGSHAYATDGTWAAFQSGSWSDISKWVSNVIPDNGGTASIVVDNNTTTGATLTLDSNRTVQNLIFGNITAFGAGPSVGTMNLASSNGAVLTLADTTDPTPVTPTIIVPSMGIQTIDPGVKTVTITANLAGSQGVNLKFGSFIGDTYTISGMGSGQYTTNHVNSVTLSGSDSFTGGVLAMDGVGSVNIGNANALNGLTGVSFANSNGPAAGGSNFLFFLGNNTFGTSSQTLTLTTGTGDRRVSVDDQSGFKNFWAGNVVLSGSSAVQFVTNGTGGQLTFNGNVDGTGLINTGLLLRGTNTASTTFGQINGNLNFPTATASSLIGKTDPGLWVLNTATVGGING